MVQPKKRRWFRVSTLVHTPDQVKVSEVAANMAEQEKFEMVDGHMIKRERGKSSVDQIAKEVFMCP